MRTDAQNPKQIYCSAFICHAGFSLHLIAHCAPLIPENFCQHNSYFIVLKQHFFLFMFSKTSAIIDKSSVIFARNLGCNLCPRCTLLLSSFGITVITEILEKWCFISTKRSSSRLFDAISMAISGRCSNCFNLLRKCVGFEHRITLSGNIRSSIDEIKFVIEISLSVE